MKLQSTIYMIAFLSGLFLTLSIYILYKNYYSKETFEVDNETNELQENTDDISLETTDELPQEYISENPDIAFDNTEDYNASSMSAVPEDYNASSMSAVPEDYDASSMSVIPEAYNAPSILSISTNTPSVIDIPQGVVQSNNSLNQSTVAQVQETSKAYRSMLTLPKKNDNFMLITTFNNLTKVKNNELRWYDDKVNIQDVIMTDFNKGSYFSLGNAVAFETDKLIQYVQGANLYNIQLTGPIALYFSNNDKSPYELSEFSLLFMIKLYSIKGTNTIFEMLCNTSVQDSQSSAYIPNVISMKLIEIDDKYFHIDVIFGTESYRVANLEKHLLVNDSINLLALTFNTANIVIRINSVPYTYVYNKKAITLGSLPVIINKNGTLPMVLYSMAYYKKALTAADMIEYIRYNMFYFNGINALLEEQQKYADIITDAENNKLKMEQMTRMLDKCVISDMSDAQIQDLSVDSLDTPYPSDM